MKGLFDGCFKFLRDLVPVFAVALVLSLCQHVRADVTLPTTGVDVADYIEAAIATLGTVAAAAIGGYVAYTALKRGIRWIRTAMT
jgi:hypothetical protein